MRLTTSQQISILETVKGNLEQMRSKGVNPFNILHPCGLCSYIGEQLAEHHILLPRIDIYIHEIFHDFTRENAVHFGSRMDSKSAYWWCVMPYDFNNRILFLNWMIKNIKLNDNKQFKLNNKTQNV
jgi:hypothetical protein